MNKNDIIKCLRQKGRDKSKPRPLLVRLSTEQLKSDILRSRKGWKPSNAFEGVKINADLTTRQQVSLSNCFREADSKNDQEKDPNVKWIVAGVTGNPRTRRIKIHVGARTKQN